MRSAPSHYRMPLLAATPNRLLHRPPHAHLRRALPLSRIRTPMRQCPVQTQVQQQHLTWITYLANECTRMDPSFHSPLRLTILSELLRRLLLSTTAPQMVDLGDYLSAWTLVSVPFMPTLLLPPVAMGRQGIGEVAAKRPLSLECPEWEWSGRTRLRGL